MPEESAGDRRSAVTLLRIAECTYRYAASQLAGGGTDPGEAAAAVVFTAGELVAVGEALRALVPLGPGERAELARRLDRAGVSRGEIAERLGVSDRSVRLYLAGG